MSSTTQPLEELMGPAIKGPTALGSDPRRLLRLTWTLATTDFKLRFFGSMLGYLWQIMRPLLLFGVLYTVFSKLLKFQGPEHFYAQSMLLAIVLFTFLGDTTAGAIQSVTAREGLVRKIEFPRLAIPLAQVLLGLFNLGLNLITVFVFLYLDGGKPRWTLLELPLIVAALALFCLGLAMLLSALWVRYRDVEPIWDVVLQMTFYATPIFYTVAYVKSRPGEIFGNLTYDRAGELLMASPFTAIVQQARHALIDPTHQSAAAAAGSTEFLLVPLGIGFAIFGLGLWVFSRMAPVIAEEL